MGLRVILYDPKGEVEYLLSDIFEVTGHTLFSLKGDEKNVLNEVKDLDSNLFILPAESKDLWIKALKYKVLFPFFILEEENSRKIFTQLGFSELNLITIPFNPLDLLNKLTVIDKLGIEPESLKDLGFINTLLKLGLFESELALKLTAEGKECSVKAVPPSISCYLDVLKDILKKDYTLELLEEEFEGKEVFGDLSEFVGRLLTEEKTTPVVKPKELSAELVEEVEEGFLSIQKLLKNRTRRRNFYLLQLNGRNREIILSVGLPDVGSTTLLRRALEHLGKELSDITAVILPTFDLQDLEVLRRLSLKAQRLTVIGRRKLGEFFNLYGISGVKLKAIEDIPYLKASLATGHVLSFIPLHDGVSMGIKLDAKLFTGNLFGSFNSSDPEIRKIFHRIVYPSPEILHFDLRMIRPHIAGTKVYPLHGTPVDAPENVYQELKNYQYKPYVVKHPEALYLFNLTLEFLSEEEIKPFLEKMSTYVEFGERIALELYTEPIVFLTELLNALSDSVSSPETFFKILKEFFNYGIYIPPSAV